MKLLKKGFIADAEKLPAPKQVCMFTTLCPLKSGKILAAFRLGSTKGSSDGNAMLAESNDQGETWKLIDPHFDPNFGVKKGEVRVAELAELEDGSLLAVLSQFDYSAGESLYNSQTDTVLPGHLIAVSSRDGGRTWNDYRRIETGEMAAPSITGPIVRLPGGGWLMAFENHQPSKAGGPSQHTACGFFSRDGRTFDRFSKIARHPDGKYFYWDQRLARCPKTGRLVAMFWTYDRKAEKDVDIHIAWGDPETLAFEEPVSTGIRGQICAPIPLPDGRLLAFYVHRHPPGSMRLALSKDLGKTWDLKNELTIHSSTAGKERGSDGTSEFGQYWEDMNTWCFGHPMAIVLKDGTVLMAHYAGRNDKCLSACWARIQVQP